MIEGPRIDLIGDGIADEPRAARSVWRIADELCDRYRLDVREIDPGALGQQPQLAQRALLSEQELRDYDRRLRRDGAQLASVHGRSNPSARRLSQHRGRRSGRPL